METEGAEVTTTIDHGAESPSKLEAKI